MPSRNMTLPFFPRPPHAYDPEYFAEFLRAFSVYMLQMQNPGEARATFIVLTDLQTNDQGLEVGAVFQVDGVLHVSLSNKPFVAGTEMTASVGSVTVTV